MAAPDIFLYFYDMKTQQYNNHKKYYPPHHFIFIPVMLLLIALGLRQYFKGEVGDPAWLVLSITSFAILYLGTMLRQHYALGNQDRIIRLEFRLRHFELLGKPSREAELALSFGQLAALRFADDAEFVFLLHRALNENLSADGIKKAITNWQADHMRV